MTDGEGIKGLRTTIDEVDDELVRLIARRLELTGEVAKEKAELSTSIRDAARERDVVERAESLGHKLGVSAPFVRKLFHDILAHTVARHAAFLGGPQAEHRRLRAAYQGGPNAYSHLAAQKHLAGLGVEGEFVGYRSFADCIGGLVEGRIDLAVLPIENTTAGSINQVYDLLRTQDVHIVGEETWRVDHCLAAPAAVPLTSLARVLSHPQAFEQCGRFLSELHHVELVPFFDTAEALAAVARQKDPTQAAIGSPEAAAAHGLHILKSGIADQDENWTRFVVLSHQPQTYDSRIPCKTSLILATRHEAGALARSLNVLSNNGLQLTKIESRPKPDSPWEYLFFVDFEGNVADDTVARALDELREAALYVKVLGSYPAKARKVETHSARLAAPSDAGAAAAARTEPPPPPAPRAPAVLRSKDYKLVDRATRPEDTRIRVGELLLGGDTFAVMAGPCAVESEQQIHEAARVVKRHGAHILRGGVFKPRTSPYSFQGLGYPGLDILAAAGRAAGLPIVTEVLSPEQVRPMAAKADILQIGARNMQNFTLLREVGKVDRPVLLKRGLSSTIDEWLAAAEYIVAQGNGQVILCERGIRTFEKATRNTLDLSAVVVLRERTHLPVIVDPSHGTGNRDYVAPLAWAARACGAHGILVEVHPDPQKALSDGPQSLNFAEFEHLMQGLRAIPAPRAFAATPSEDRAAG